MNTTTSLRDQVRSLLSQGYKVGAEHADQRRFKTSSWLSCGSITGQREDQILHEIEAFLQDNQGEYVRLIGIDPQAKRRVLETIIQRPGDKPTQTTSSGNNGYYKSSPAHHGPSNTNNGQVSSNVRSHLRSLMNQGYKRCDPFLRIDPRRASRRIRSRCWHRSTSKTPRFRTNRTKTRGKS
jgi:carbon dioxide concentrating mechanism protein CcmM